MGYKWQIRWILSGRDNYIQRRDVMGFKGKRDCNSREKDK